jgi:hypothetical protein
VAEAIVAAKAASPAAANANDQDDAREIIKGQGSHEIWFGVVGPVGAGGTRAIDGLKQACKDAGYEPEVIKMSALIREWAKGQGKSLPPDGQRSLEIVELFQNLGDELRKADTSAIARHCLREIAQRRAKLTGVEFKEGQPVKPDGKKRAWLIDSIKHPAETQLFRKAYGNAFALVGVVCEEAVRAQRIKTNS